MIRQSLPRLLVIHGTQGISGTHTGTMLVPEWVNVCSNYQYEFSMALYILIREKGPDLVFNIVLDIETSHSHIYLTEISYKFPGTLYMGFSHYHLEHLSIFCYWKFRLLLVLEELTINNMNIII